LRRLLADEFLAEVQQTEKKNLALEALRKLLGDGIRSRSKANVVQTKAFSERLEDALARYHANTIVVPAREEGFKQRFLNENCWFAVRINAKHISKLKFIAAYQVALVAAITHIAEVEAILPYNDTGKYMIKFKGPATAIVPIPRPENSEVNMQSFRYARREGRSRLAPSHCFAASLVFVTHDCNAFSCSAFSWQLW
jgi:hypothetical protein